MKINLFIAVLLFLVSVVITFALVIPSAVVKAWKVCRKESSLTDWLIGMAMANDRLWNVMADDFFNCLLIKDKSIAAFGNGKEFVSSVLGKNEIVNNLTWCGRMLVATLNLIEENHVQKWINK